MTIVFSGPARLSNVTLKRGPFSTLSEIITDAGLTSGLQFALDAGDSNSYSGIGQRWFDTSGNGFDFFRGADSSVAIPQGEGTLIGDMTENAGLAAAFNGVTIATQANCAANTFNQPSETTAEAFVGKDFGAGNEKIISQATTYGASDVGYGSNPPARFFQVTLFGSNTAPSNPNDGTQLGIVASLETDTTQPLTIISTDTTNAYRYVWIRNNTAIGNGEKVLLAEVEFKEIGVESDDPTFNGTAGDLGLNEYWSFDGGDFFTYDSTNESWMNSLHQNNAVFTIAGWIHTPITASSGKSLLAFGNGSNQTTFNIQINGNNNFQLSVLGDAGLATLNSPTGGFVSDTVLSNDAWHFVAVSMDESIGAGGGFFYNDGSFNQVSGADTWNSTYSTPSSNPASTVMRIGANDSPVFQATGRMAELAAWTVALTKANLDVIYNATKGRFGL